MLMPQLDFYAYNTIVALTLTIFFTLLYLTMYYFLPKIAEILKLRENLDIVLKTTTAKEKNNTTKATTNNLTLNTVNKFIIIVITKIKELW